MAEDDGDSVARALRFLGHNPFLSLLVEELKENAKRIALLALVSGVANGVVVAIINAAAATRANEQGVYLPRYLILFFLTVLAFIVTRRFVLLQSGVCSEAIVRKFRARIVEKIGRSELATFDRMEATQVFVTLSDNTTKIGQAALPIFNACGSLVMLLFCLGYMFTISKLAFAITIGMTVLSVVHFFDVSERMQESLIAAYGKEKKFFSTVMHLLRGIKEVKMSRAREDDLLGNHLVPLACDAERLKVQANAYNVHNWIFTKVYVFFLIAAIIFLLPVLQGADARDLVELTAVALFMISPLGDVVEAIPLLAQANVAVTKLRELENSLVVLDRDENAPSVTRMRGVAKVESLELDRATFSYVDRSGTPSFIVGPVDMKISAGEIAFIVGGNGSGKSTLLKMLTGLYPPASGTIRLNEIPVDRDNAPAFREFFSAIYTDFHLFDRLYGFDALDDAQLDALLHEMKLEDKTGVVDGAFTNLELSTGQKKRLALIVSLLEDRPICVFDEVAADQDPHFRRYFYETILKKLKNKGKMVIVVSHEERSFFVADHVYRLDYGRLTSPLDEESA